MPLVFLFVFIVFVIFWAILKFAFQVTFSIVGFIFKLVLPFIVICFLIGLIAGALVL